MLNRSEKSEYDAWILPPRLARPTLDEIGHVLAAARRGASVESLSARLALEWLFALARWWLLSVPALMYFFGDARLADEAVYLFVAILLFNVSIYCGLSWFPLFIARYDLAIRLVELVFASGTVTLIHLMTESIEFNATYGILIVAAAIGGGVFRAALIGVVTLLLMTASNTYVAHAIASIPTGQVIANVLAHGCIFALMALTTLILLGRERQMSHFAHTDSLTGLHNQRAFYPTLRYVARAAKLERKPLSLLLCDLDHFKRVNDTFGHAVGDEVLHEAAIRLRNTVGPTAIASRIGGEEFAVILPRAHLEEAYELAEQIREAIGRAPAPHGETITASLGVATWIGPLDTPDDLLKRADEALYAAKEAGRNCTRVSELV